MAAALLWTAEGFVPAAGGPVDPADRGLLLSDGVFDTALAIGGRPALGEAHLARLAAALETLAIPVAAGTLARAYEALARACGTGSMRLTVTRGPGFRGLALPAELRPTILGSHAPLAPAAMFAPLVLIGTPIRRNDTSPASRLKSLSYLDAVLANAEARRAGADEALFLNTAGRVACTALGSLLLLTEDGVATPPVSEGVLPGTVRGWVLANAAALGLEARERPIAWEEVAAGGATLVSANSLRLLAPARLLGRAPTPPPASLHRLAEALCRAIAAECGTDPRALGAALLS